MGTYKISNDEIDEHSHKADPFGRYSKPIFLGIGKELEVNDVGHGETNSAIIPAIAPPYLSFEKMPMINVEKEDAASPKAKATVLVTKLDGGLIQSKLPLPRLQKRQFGQWISC